MNERSFKAFYGKRMAALSLIVAITMNQRVGLKMKAQSL
jgi:hypothetical protein